MKLNFKFTPFIVAGAISLVMVCFLLDSSNMKIDKIERKTETIEDKLIHESIENITTENKYLEEKKYNNSKEKKKKKKFEEPFKADMGIF